MVRVFNTKYGRVALKSWASYVNEGLFAGSMQSVAKQEKVDIVLLVGEKVDLPNYTDAEAEALVEMAMSAIDDAEEMTFPDA